MYFMHISAVSSFHLLMQLNSKIIFVCLTIIYYNSS